MKTLEFTVNLLDIAAFFLAGSEIIGKENLQALQDFLIGRIEKLFGRREQSKRIRSLRFEKISSGMHFTGAYCHSDYLRYLLVPKSYITPYL
jgi:hypothetical protein